ncbi:MAG: YceI family protein [Acidobacteria bacterium]|nr:YceI family protein [Acidobacteriota bacterium]MCI0566636.1 YceI family protein [Acidobacteriota bacterium]
MPFEKGRISGRGHRVEIEPQGLTRANRRGAAGIAAFMLIGVLSTSLVQRAVSASAITQGVLRFTILPTRSTVRFDADATGHTVHGITHQVSGWVSFDPEDLSRRAEVSFKVEAATLDTGNKSRDKKMRDSHLETGRHPVIVFQSSKVKAIAPTLRAGETQEMEVTGALSLHGTERVISFPVKAVRRGEELVVTGETSLRMTDYGIPIPAFLFMKVKDEVKVMFEVVATPSPAEN